MDLKVLTHFNLSHIVSSWLIQPLDAGGNNCVQLTFQGVAKHPELKLVPDEPANDTDVDGTLQKLMENDASVTEVNLNNIKVIVFIALCDVENKFYTCIFSPILYLFLLIFLLR